MERLEGASASDLQSTDVDQSSTTIGCFSEMEFQLSDSDESMEQELSSSCEASSSSQNNGGALTEKERSRSQTNWQYEYFQAEPDVASVKSISPFRQKSNATEAFTYKWNATTIGSKSTHEEQLKPNRRTLITEPKGRPLAKLQLHYSQAVPSPAAFEPVSVWRQSRNVSENPRTATVTSAEHRPTIYANKIADGDLTNSSGSQSDSDKTFDDLYSEPFDSTSIARKLMKRAEEKRRVEFKQRISMANSKIQSKWPMYLTRYSPEVLTETDVHSEDLFPLSTAAWHKRGNAMSSNGRSDSPRPSSEELNKTGDGASRHYTMLTSSRELEPASMSNESKPTPSPNEPGELFDSTSLAREQLSNSGKVGPLDVKRSILITNPDAWSNRPLFQTRYYPETVVNSKERQHPLSTTKLCSSIESKPTPSVNESTEIEITKLPQTTPAIEQQTPTQSSKFIDPTTSIGIVPIEEKNISPPENPQQLDDLISVPATPHSDALNEIIVSESAPSEYCNDKPTGEEKFAAPDVSPEPFIQPTNIGNVSIEENKISPPERPQNVVDSMKAPVTSQNDVSDDPALWDHRYSKLFEDFETPPASPTEFIFSSSSSNVPIEPTFLPAQSSEDNGLSAVSTPVGLSDVSAPAASPSDVNEILISVPPDPSVEATPPLPPAASAIAPGKLQSLKQPNPVQMPNPVQIQNHVQTSSEPNSSVKAQKRPYNRKNKIQVQSNELIALALPIGSTIQTPSNAAVRINPDQKIFDPKAANTQMASKLPVNNEVKPNQINLAKRKKTEKLQRSKVSNETLVNSTTTGVASLKRTYAERLPSHVPTKVQKVQEPAQAIMKDVKNCATVAGVSRGGQNSVDRSFEDCVLFLQRNNVSVFKVPQNPSQALPKPSQFPPPNWDKYMKILQKNNVSVERINKNISRI